MGEIVRLIIIDLLQQELLFLGHRDTYGDYKTPLYDRGGFYTKFVSTVETDEGRIIRFCVLPFFFTVYMILLKRY